MYEGKHQAAFLNLKAELCTLVADIQCECSVDATTLSELITNIQTFEMLFEVMRDELALDIDGCVGFILEAYGVKDVPFEVPSWTV